MLSMPTRSLSEIAAEIEREWKPKIGGEAQPYVNAMQELQSLNDYYGLDRAASIVAGFSGAASTWRGAIARRVKAELKAMLVLHENSN
jgi:hypothetical protein